jgi:hypothetical protein
LKYLNLSQNEIELFEEESFQNLNKLEILDLSFNRFKMIQANLFRGLDYLKDLHLLLSNQFQFQMNNQSLSHLTNIGNIYLNESTIKEFKCIFMHYMERKIQRQISNKYLFFKSINLLTLKNVDVDENECQMKFQFLQFKIHFNLKTDFQNEWFYEKCQRVLTKNENRFKNSENNCLLRNHFISSQIDEDQNEKETLKAFLVFSNGVYLFTMFLLIVLLGLVYLLLIIHLYEFDLPQQKRITNLNEHYYL